VLIGLFWELMAKTCHSFTDHWRNSNGCRLR